jgi:lipid-binding SYLF domain-containing protein
MAVFPTDFAPLDPARSLNVLVDNGTSNGVITIAALLGLVQTTDIYTRLLASVDTVDDVAANVTTYAVALGDNAKVKRFLCSGACVVNIPQGLPVGFAIEWIQDGAGLLTFQSASGAGQVIESPEGLRSGGRYGSGVLRCKASNTWQLAGYTQV